MDTKSKSTNLTRGIFSWFCYLLVFFALIAVAFYSLVIFNSYGSDIFNSAERAIKVGSDVIIGELRELSTYKENASSFFERLYYNAGTSETESMMRDADGSFHYGAQYLESISRDNLYSVTDYRTDPAGVTVTNDPNWTPGTIPQDFNYLFTCESGVVQIFHILNDGTWACVFNSDVPGAFYTNTLSYTLDAIESDPNKPDIYFAVRTEPTSYYASNEIVSSAQNYANHLLFQIILLSVALLLFLLILILGIVFRKDRLLLTERMAGAMKRVWIEIKAAVFFIALCCSILLIFSSGSVLHGGIPGIIGFYIVFLLIHLVLIDISHNRHIWRHNIIHSILKVISGTRHGKRFEQIEYRKYLAVMAVLLGLGLITAIVTVIAWYEYRFWDLLPIFYAAVAIAAAGTLFWFAAALREDLRDYSALMDQIEQMYQGDLNAVNHLPSTSPLYSSAMQLNMIRDGIKIAVEEGIKSERTKVELITNVSHDIKTPLTSIIGYIELLKTEEDLPPHVMDYIEIISQKSSRLRYMIQDIFDVSKAATGNITLEPEYMNLKMLLQQTMADMGELIESSSLQWRVQIPEDSYPVYVDGQRMYRVFQNLIKNAAQYALEGSRVYIALVKQGSLAVFSIQNISKYELQTDGETLTGRFVRGDDSRSTSGSGLGLSIAKSFTEACGGTFKVTVNGDLFSAEITLPLSTPPKQTESYPQIEAESEPDSNTASSQESDEDQSSL